MTSSDGAAPPDDTPRRAPSARGMIAGDVPRARHLLHVFPSFAVGGSQRRLSLLAARLGAAFRHTVIALDGVTEAAGLFDPVVTLAMRPEPLPKRRTLANVVRARAIIGALRPDRLVTYNWGAIEFALAARLLPALPHLHCEDGFGPEEANGLLYRRTLMRRLALGRARIAVPSHGLARIATDIWKLPRRQVVHLPNGVDLERFAVDRTAPRPVGHVPHIGTVAALRPEKNLARLLAAAASLKDRGPIRLTIVGDGPERQTLAREALRLGLDAERIFVGASPTPERELAQFDIFALSSDTEQMPLTVLEAMAAGLPVAAVDVGDVATMVSDENRPFVVPHDADRLAAALGALLDQPARGALLGAANRAKAVARFGLESMVTGWRALFD